MKRQVRTRMLGVVGAGGEKPPATRFWRGVTGMVTNLLVKVQLQPLKGGNV